MKRTFTLMLAMLFCINLFPWPASAAGNLPFADIANDAWYYSDVKTAVDSGLVNGKSATTYCPDDHLTYAEAVKLAACMYQKNETGTVSLVNGNPWYQSYVDYAKEKSIITKDFNWNAKATRAGYMSIFAHALPDASLAPKNEVSDGAIPDVPMTHPQAAEIYKLYRAGILQGSDEKHSCKPDDNIKRSEVAAILTRMMFADKRIGFTMQLNAGPSMPTDPFNRITIRYSAPTPSKLTVSYEEGSGIVTDVFYLEKGDNAEFSALIKSYLKNKSAKNLKIISAESLTKGAAPDIHAVSGETISFYGEEIYYLENERYKVGINLNWGGGVSEIYDKKNTIPGLTNLINRFDTGRSIQQSYYGTEGNSEYTPGEYIGRKWPYNPVQGGNAYNQPSRLIDIIVKKDSVWVKSQPADWGRNNYLTPSYMENTYSFTGDCIMVDNRFVDFSCWEHPINEQEIPAIYFVSWLGDFVWYSGDKSWSNDTLSWDSDLPFWDGAADRCWKRMAVRQTETWCAWMNRGTDYGVGIYVPGADLFSAGRDDYNGTKDSSAGNTNYVAPLERIQIVSFEPIGYSYLLTAGSVDTIRSTFQKNKDLIKNEMLDRSNLLRILMADYTTLDFTRPENVEAFRDPLFDAVAEYDKQICAVKLVSTTGIDPYLSLIYDNSTVKLSADELKTLRMTYMIPTTNSQRQYDGEVFLCSGDRAAGNTEAGISKGIPGLVGDGKWHTIEIDLSAGFWKGDIHSIRLDFFNECAAGDMMYVKNISLAP